MPLMTIEFEPTHVRITDKDHDGYTTIKTVSPQAFIEAMNSDAEFQTGLLPPNTRYYRRIDRSEHIVVEVPPSIRTVTYKRREYKIPVPRILACFSMRNESAGYSSVYSTSFSVLKMPLLGPTTETYQFPFPNVDINVCWGSNALPKYQRGQYQSLCALVDLFFDAPFNDDLDNHSFAPFDYIDIDGRVRRATHFPDLIDYLDGKDEFPLGILVREETFEQWLSRRTSR